MTDGIRAGIYTRMSRADMDDQTKVDDQERRCRDLAAARGWEVADVYPDNNRSAWQRNRKRPGWDAMLSDVNAGKINAIIVYHGDRLIRQPRDLEDLIDLARGKGIRLASPAGDRDLDSSDDQFVLSIEAAMARRESANISRRQKARYERDRRNGRIMAQGPGGRRLGYRSDGVALYPADRCDVATRAEVSEADIVREMAGRTLAGESASSIEASLRDRGWTTPGGSRIGHGSLRRWLANPRYAGLMPDGETRAAWPAILERETWERVRLVLEARAAAHPREGGPAANLLTGIARCGTCGRTLMTAHVSSRGYRARVYGCDKREGGCGKVWRNAELLDAYVSGRVVGALNSEGTPEGNAPAPPDMTGEWRALATERAAAEALIADHAASPGRVALLMRRLDGIDARMAEMRELEAGDARSRLLARYRGLTRAQWKALPLEVRRSLVRATVTVTVLPASKRGPGFRPQDARVEPVS
jgi:site-specific DNA recombinase